ncbi:HupE/UreJ family protein [Rhodobacter sp.]
MRFLLPVILGVVAAGPAFAHIGQGDAGGSLVAGLLHPLLGVDHLLAIVGAGLWASLSGPRAMYMVPACFIGAMALGFVLALMGLPLPAVEAMILASVVVLGLAVALAIGADPRVFACMAGCFALFHGYAHGAEIGDAAAFTFGIGFVGATATLLAAGIGLGDLAGRTGLRGRQVAQGLGGLVAVVAAASALGA